MLSVFEGFTRFGFRLSGLVDAGSAFGASEGLTPQTLNS